jgi:AGCS family alanine or glycine:cation symporter
LGATIIIAMREGASRSLFATEAGLGSAPIVSAAVKTDNPVQQALVAYTAPFWTVIICTLTGVTLTTSFLAAGHTGASQYNMLSAFSSIGSVGTILLTISLSAFAVSTLLGWSYYGEKSLEYLGGRRLITPYRVLWVVAVYVGCVISESTIVWNFSDIANGLMAIPNLICVIALSGVILKETRYYLKDNNLYKKDEAPIPVEDEKN